METYGNAWFEAQITNTIELWNRSAAGRGRNPRRYSSKEQAIREGSYDEALCAVEDELQDDQRAGSGAVALKDRIVASFARFSAKALDLDGEAIQLLTHEFLPVGTELARWARRFDAGLSMPDIIQAARNAWTACGLQPLLGLPVSLTPAILGYSLLYPYSDNYLDDVAVRSARKLQFSRRFRSRLLGHHVSAADDRERAMWSLISLIEMQYPRAQYPEVFESLLAIHQAQEQSISQINASSQRGDRDTLRLSCAKGGSSVLADACLGRGSLTSQESRFAFEWGVLLQLGDDLQDIHDDLRRGSTTLFSRRAAQGGTLDGLTVQLLNFSEAVGKRMDALPHGTTTLKELLKMSWQSLIIRAVADSHEFFSPHFLREAEACSPFRFEFLRARRDRLASRQGLYAKLFNALLESDDDRDSPSQVASAAPSDQPYGAGISVTKLPLNLEAM